MWSQVTPVEMVQKTMEMDAGLITTNNKAYGGMGVAKPSAWIDFQDSKFNGRLQALFNEHVEVTASSEPCECAIITHS